MKIATAFAVSLVMAAAAWAGDENDFYPQARRGGGVRGGAKVWLSMETIRAPLEATDASGSNPVTHTKDAFNDDIETFLQQSLATVNFGYEVDQGITIYGKLGFAYSTLVQDTEITSAVGGPDRRGGAIDPYLVYGVGASFSQAAGGQNFFFGRLELTAGEGDIDGDYSYHDVSGDGDVSFARVEGRVGFGTYLESAAAYIGLRYNHLIMTLSLDDTPAAPPDFEVDYAYDTPVGIFFGVGSKPGDRIIWHAEIGFIDNDDFSFEAGAGVAF